MDRKLITLSPDLERLAGEWSPEKQLRMARKFLRWHHELRMSAHLRIAARNRGPFRRSHLKRVPPLTAALN